MEDGRIVGAGSRNFPEVPSDSMSGFAAQDNERKIELALELLCP